MAIFVEMEKSILKFTWNSKETQVVKTILKGNHKDGGLTLSDFKTYLQGLPWWQSA